jgi:hypothetical protein
MLGSAQRTCRKSTRTTAASVFDYVAALIALLDLVVVQRDSSPTRIGIDSRREKPPPARPYLSKGER